MSVLRFNVLSTTSLNPKQRLEMPTPDDTNNVPPTPPIETSSSRASFTSCPPEEEREIHAPREARADTPSQQYSSPAELERRHTARQEPTPEPEAQAGAAEGDDREKAEHVEDGAIVADSPSPVGSPETVSDSEVRSAQSLATTALSIAEANGELAPQYLYYPPVSSDRVRTAHASLLEQIGGMRQS